MFVLRPGAVPPGQRLCGGRGGSSASASESVSRVRVSALGDRELRPRLSCSAACGAVVGLASMSAPVSSEEITMGVEGRGASSDDRLIAFLRSPAGAAAAALGGAASSEDIVIARRLATSIVSSDEMVMTTRGGAMSSEDAVMMCRLTLVVASAAVGGVVQSEDIVMIHLAAVVVLGSTWVWGCNWRTVSRPFVLPSELIDMTLWPRVTSGGAREVVSVVGAASWVRKVLGAEVS